ncbi:threonylcarbamoyl-AMP synthase-like [Physella acuta]|uniref:threonylcarbamoyl-AMP synthase-like n=1 Tax=Physella acuta TaxID=109671 RepID=UPI0027DB2618|nr:threonylcarbamoyl-AMP synthase-like [Physella acuta]
MYLRYQKLVDFNMATQKRKFNARNVNDLEEAAALIKSGKLLGIPTDTVYAIAASVKHPASVQRIFDVKKRPSEIAISLLLANKQTLVDTEPDFHKVLLAFIKPAAYGFVVPKGKWLEKLCPASTIALLGDEDSICIRIPTNAELSLFCTKTGPMAISSANIHGTQDSTNSRMVDQAFGDKIDGIVDAGKALSLTSSSIVNCLDIPKKLCYFRIGSTSQETIYKDYMAAKKEVEGGKTTT